MENYLENLLQITRILLFPSFHFLNGLCIIYTPTFEDLKYGDISIFIKIKYTLVYVILLVLTLPLVIIFFPLRILLLYIRKPYQYSVVYTPFTSNASEPLKTRNKSGVHDFSVATANILLFAEYPSRLNHMKNVDKRSKEIGERIVIDQFFPRNHLNSSSHGKKEWLRDASFTNDDDVEGKIRTHFSSLDFFCVQEAFSNYHNKILMKELHKVFPHIVHDVGVHAPFVNRFFFNSGLMIASRYPLAAIDFKPFTHFVSHSVLLSQGMLMTKVIIETPGPDAKTGQKVGYIFNTHLQAYQGTSRTIPKQLDEMLIWGDEFIGKTKTSDDEILFCILCGDFNSDNMSPADRECYNHELFKVYKDFGRLAPGKDKDWAVGTTMRQRYMLDPSVTSPEGLKRALQDPSLRRQYISDANLEIHTKETSLQDPSTDENGQILPISVGGKRRMDLITYHSKYSVKVKSYDFVTRLASLTDHVPVQMTFSCPVSRKA